jgi:hypothetical protein
LFTLAGIASKMLEPLGGLSVMLQIGAANAIGKALLTAIVEI